MFVKKQALLNDAVSLLDKKKTILNNEIDNLNLQSNIYDNGLEYQNPIHPYTSDLDIFGENSLFHYINRCKTSNGKFILAQMLSSCAHVTEIEKRAKAFEEINIDIQKWVDFRTNLFAFQAKDFDELKLKIGQNLHQSLSFIKSKFLIKCVNIIPYVSAILLITAFIFQGVFYSIFGCLMVFNFVLYNLYIKKINKVHYQIELYDKKFKDLSELLKVIENTNWESELLKENTAVIQSSNGEKLQTQFFKLSKIIVDFNYRNNILVGTFLNLILLWDFKIVKKLYQWHHQSSNNIIKSFELIAQFEAYVSIATFNYNHPHFIKPQISLIPEYNFKEITHPLISHGKNIPNDFESKNLPQINIITGSNMAGKSTFLRTIATNMVLAFAGANVSAKYFKTSVFSIVTYMRIVDSLKDSTSTFKAEINRLKLIIDEIDKHRDSLIFIDEMLRGTNSVDKYLGGKAFIKFLISKNVTAFFATHDLQIADLAIEYPNAIQNFYFDVDFENQQMNFDYKIKNGKCTKFNASLLLKEIGIE